jgi:hypothetical protein
MKTSGLVPPSICFRKRLNRAWAVCGLILLLLGAASGLGADVSFSEYQVKALFLFNFAKYVDWPAEAFSSGTSPIIIGIVGQDNFADNLKHAVEGKSINGRSIVIKHIASDAELGGCHVLFISSSENSRFEAILGKTSTLPVLTVSEREQSSRKSAIVNFILAEKKVRLEIDLDAARQTNLRISSKLLRVADLVKGKSN